MTAAAHVSRMMMSACCYCCEQEEKNWKLESSNSTKEEWKCYNTKAQILAWVVQVKALVVGGLSCKKQVSHIMYSINYLER
mgnify:CR=1 FL=1